MNCPKCQTPIKDHPTGGHLDTLFCEKVMEWERFLDFTIYRYKTPDGRNMPCHRFKPSTNIVHAMEGEKKVKDSNQHWEYIECLHRIVEGDVDWRVHPGSLEMINATAHQRTRALILWAMGEGE